MLRGTGDEQGADAGAAADVHGMLHGFRGALQVVMNDLGEAVAVRAEEHRITGVGGKRRMHQQQVVQARPAHGAAQQITLARQHLGRLQLLQLIGRDQPRRKWPAPTEDVAQRAGPLAASRALLRAWVAGVTHVKR